jgi:hypothetical protein
MPKDRIIRVLLLSIVILLTINCILILRRPTTVSAQQNPYKMLIIPVNEDGKKAFEQAVNNEGYKLESFHLGSEWRTGVMILKK